MPFDINRRPTIDDIRAAAKRLKGEAVRTPLLESRELNQKLSGRVFLKPEMLQITGSFKYRGAFNKLSLEIERNPALQGVVAFSSGNHGQGVAAAARKLGLQAIIVMPKDAPAIKIANTRAFGADVVLYDRYKEDREKIAREISQDKGFIIAPPYDDPGIIAGQGTIGEEISEDLKAIGIKPDIVLAPCSGGGLIAGIALSLHHHFPDAEIYSCEPSALDDTARSLAAGKRVTNSPDSRSICDALMSSIPGELTFSINRDHLRAGLSVSDEEALTAMAFSLRRLKLVTEPGGSVALAALLSGHIECNNKIAVVLLTGGNADDAMIERALASNLATPAA